MRRPLAGAVSVSGRPDVGAPTLVSVGCLLFTRFAGCRLPAPKILKGRWERRHGGFEPGRKLVMRPADAVHSLLFELVAFPFERLADQECRRRSDCGAAAGFGQAGALGAQLD